VPPRTRLFHRCHNNGPTVTINLQPTRTRPNPHLSLPHNVFEDFEELDPPKISLGNFTSFYVRLLFRKVGRIYGSSSGGIVSNQNQKPWEYGAVFGGIFGIAWRWCISHKQWWFHYLWEGRGWKQSGSRNGRPIRSFLDYAMRKSARLVE